MSEVKLKSSLVEIGRILKLFREKTGRLQAPVAESAGISVSMLSQIERGAVSPSIETLLGVCGALGLDVSELFRRLSPQAPVRVTSPRNRIRTEEKGIRYEQLVTSPDPSHPGEMFLLEVEAGTSVGLEGGGHEGVEMGYVLKGRALLTVDGTAYELREGDSVTFASHLPHKLENAGNGLFRAVWTVSPPHKDFLNIN